MSPPMATASQSPGTGERAQAPSPDAQAVLNCPTCGAKRTRPDSTLCAYCATPFDLVSGNGAAEGGESPNRERLERMKDHQGFAEAAEWVPLESAEYQRLEATAQRGRQVAVLGLVVAGLVAWWASPLWAVVPALALVWGLVGLVRARAGMARILALPLLKRPAIVLDRRSETAMGFWAGTTVYYFDLEFVDGSGGEFRWPGRGIDHQPLVVGATGLAFTRGETLLGFRSLRV